MERKLSIDICENFQFWFYNFDDNRMMVHRHVHFLF